MINNINKFLWNHTDDGNGKVKNNCNIASEKRGNK